MKACLNRWSLKDLHTLNITEIFFSTLKGLCVLPDVRFWKEWSTVMESCITGFICTRICTPAELKILMKNVDCLKMVMPSKGKREKEKNVVCPWKSLQSWVNENFHLPVHAVTQGFPGNPSPSIHLTVSRIMFFSEKGAGIPLQIDVDYSVKGVKKEIYLFLQAASQWNCSCRYFHRNIFL